MQKPNLTVVDVDEKVAKTKKLIDDHFHERLSDKFKVEKRDIDAGDDIDFKGDHEDET